ncbi:hypothetical protein M3Y99_01721600 [Aphelenchoides fujianensis]|nr:hypothetical protein M3Y99_01721600 [Aphelenchoides fujianensis]
MWRRRDSPPPPMDRRGIGKTLSLVRMLSVALLLLGPLHALKQQENTNEIYEIRIYENAPPGTKATLNEAWTPKVDWLEFDSPLLIFLTTREVPSSAATMQYATLNLMCASNTMRAITFSLHVTRRNRHPPRFTDDHYKFYAPATLGVGLEVGAVKVLDGDPIIYNSQFAMNLVPLATGMTTHTHWSVHKNGSLNVRLPMGDLPLYKPVDFKVVAYDFWLAAVVLDGQNLRDSRLGLRSSQSARERRQCGLSDLRVGHSQLRRPRKDSHRESRVRAKRSKCSKVDGEETIAMSKIQFQPGGDYSVRATAIDTQGGDPVRKRQLRHSEERYKQRLPANHSIHFVQISCVVGAVRTAVRPMCFYGRTHKLEQYRDINGLHCLCYEGFSGAQCDSVEKCGAERAVEVYGGVNWEPTFVNQSGSVPCPYNADDAKLERRCIWERERRRRPRPLGRAGNYVQRPDITTAGFSSVQRFLTSDPQVPFVQPLGYFDEKIAEHTAQLLDAMLSRNLRSLPGNVTTTRLQLMSFVSEFAHRLPTPYSLESVSGGLQMRSQQWIAGADSFPTPMSNRCYLHLPKALRTAIVNMVCVKNNTIYDVPEATTSTDVPAMLVESQDPRDPLVLPAGTRALIALRPPPPARATPSTTRAPSTTSGRTAGRRRASPSCRGTSRTEWSSAKPSTSHSSPSFHQPPTGCRSLLNVLPIITSGFASIVTLFLLAVVLFQRKIDPALPLFLIALGLVHGAHLFIFSMPNFFNIRPLDGHLYLLLQYALLASAALIGLLNSSLYSKVCELELDYRGGRALLHAADPSSPSLRFVMIPGLSCLFTWLYNGQLFIEIVSKTPHLLPLNLTFVLCFLVPFVLYVGIAVGYGGSAFHCARRLMRRGWLGEIKNGLLGDLKNGGRRLALPAARLLRGGIRNVTFAVLQLLTALMAFVYVGYLSRVHSRFLSAAHALAHSPNNDEVASAATSSTGVAYRNISAHSHEQLGKEDRLLHEQNGADGASSQRPPLHGMVTELGPGGYRTSALMKQELGAGRYAKPRPGVSFEPALHGSREPSFIDEPSGAKRSGQPLVSIV